MYAPDETRSPALPNLPDRWTKPKMALFLRELASSHCVAAAATAVGMSRQSAYKLRNRLKGEPFDIAWEAAFQHGYDALHQAALERALHGTEVPVFFNGEQIGTRRHFDERLTCFLLSARNHQGAQQLGRYRAATDFWAERWDLLLEQVETESARWQCGADAEVGSASDGDEAERDIEDEADRAERELAAVRAAERYTAPDPLPGKRGQ